MAKMKKKVLQGVSEAHYLESLGHYAEAEARENKITSTIDVEINAIKQQYAEELQRLAEKKQMHFDVVMAYCVENKEAIFGKKRSIDTIHGVLGFRLGTPKLKTLKGFTWPAVTNLLKELLPSYVRTVDEPAKDKLLADKDDSTVAAMLPKVGIWIDQEDGFFIKTPETKGAEIK